MGNYEPEMVVGSVFRKLGDNENSANAWGPWDPEAVYRRRQRLRLRPKMKNGATIVLESSWAINMIDTNEAKTILCGDKAGADMLGKDGALRINGERFSKMYVTEPALTAEQRGLL